MSLPVREWAVPFRYYVPRGSVTSLVGSPHRLRSHRDRVETLPVLKRAVRGTADIPRSLAWILPYPT